VQVAAPIAMVDVVFLNIRERAAELATIRSFGWRESALARLVVTEGAVIVARLLRRLPVSYLLAEE
jgi:putative ABC transport system permease protein